MSSMNDFKLTDSTFFSISRSISFSEAFTMMYHQYITSENSFWNTILFKRFFLSVIQWLQGFDKVFDFYLAAILHLYFARFFNHFLCDSGLLKHREPFIHLLTQGMVMGESYCVKSSGKYLRKDQVDFSGNSLHLYVHV